MSDYTIIITSYNRPKTLLRTLKFLFDCDNSVQIIIAKHNITSHAIKTKLLTCIALFRDEINNIDAQL